MKYRKYIVKKAVAFALCIVALVASLGISGSTMTVLANEALVKGIAGIDGSIVNHDFSTFENLAEEKENEKTIDKVFVGISAYSTGKNEVSLVDEGTGTKVLKLNAIESTIKTYKGKLELTDSFGIECRVRFDNATSLRKIGGMKGISEGENYAWLDMLQFTESGKIIDATKTEIGSYAANVWYTIQIEVDTPNQVYRVWIKNDQGDKVVSAKHTLNTGGKGDKKWRGCVQTNLFEQNSSGSMEIAYVKAGNVIPYIDEIEIENQEMRVGEKLTLDPSVLFPGQDTTGLTYTSSDTSIVTVSGNQLEALKLGVVTVTATDSVSGATGTFKVGVNGVATVSGNIVDYDFNSYDLAAEENSKITIDDTFVGSIGIKSGDNGANLVQCENGKNVLKLNAIKQTIKTYKGGLELTDSFGIECRVRFDNNTSLRKLGGMKGIEKNGEFAWLDMLQFTASGEIKDVNSAIGSYAANVWYTIQIEVDTPNQVYRVWIKDDNGAMYSFQETLNFKSNKTAPWYGCCQTNLFEQNSSGSMEIAYLKAGFRIDVITGFNYNDIEMTVGEAMTLEPAVVPENAYAKELQYTSSDSNVVEVVGTSILALAEGTSTITVKDSFTGVEGSFMVNVKGSGTNWDLRYVDEDILNLAIHSSYRSQIDYTEAQIRELFENDQYGTPESYIEMNKDDFIAAVEADFLSLTKPDQMETNKYEKLSRYLILMYRVTGEKAYAERAAMILYTQAKHHPELLKVENYIKSNDPHRTLATNAVFTFGYLVNMEKDGVSVWESAGPEGISAKAVKQTIAEMHLRPVAYKCMQRISGKSRLGNLDGYGARTVSVIASIINDPYLMRQTIMFHDRLFSEDYYYFDGMWEEGALSYGNQVIGNALSAIEAASVYEDPFDYKDPENPEAYGLDEKVMGLKLPCEDLKDRWILLEKAQDVANKFVYPDGSLVPVCDTWYKTTSTIEPIKEELLNNYELPGFGYYGLVQGTVDNAVQTGLLYEAAYRGGSGHEHVRTLAMTLWGAGTELLPDPGYAIGDAMYPARRWVFHNMPFIFRTDGANETNTNKWAEPRLLSYDDGTENEGVITLVEASFEGDGAEVKQRLLMNIQLDESHSYVFDLSRMKGGNAHDLFQRGSELEAMTTTVNGITFTDTGKASLSKVDEFSKYYNNKHNLIKDFDYLHNPKEADGSEDFSFTWEGNETGSRVTTYMNGVDGSKVYLSSIPVQRRASASSPLTGIKAPHITRYNSVEGEELTKYGAVHETARAGEENLVEAVKWSYLENDSMGIYAKITSKDYIDYIYVSGDTEERTIDGITFAGKTAMVRCDKEDGNILYSYVYGDGKAAEVNGTAAVKLPVTGLQTASVLRLANAENTENVITVQGTVQDVESYIGKRVLLVFGDGSGYGMKVKSIKENGDGTIALETEEYVPMALQDGGVISLFNPYGVQTKISGDVSVIFEKATGKSYIYSVKIDTEIEHGTVAADKAEAQAGEVITLSVVPDEGYHLKEGSLKVNGVPVTDGKFTMPDEAVTITAEFEKIPVESGNAGSGNTGSGNTSSGNAGSGNTGSGNAGSGNAGSGNTGSGNTGSGSTGSGSTGSSINITGNAQISDKDDVQSTPMTGDASPVAAIIIIMVLSAAGILASLLYRKRKNGSMTD